MKVYKQPETMNVCLEGTISLMYNLVNSGANEGEEGNDQAASGLAPRRL